jgi:hypothetical protein
LLKHPIPKKHFGAKQLNFQFEKLMVTRRLFSFACLAALCLSGCGGGGSSMAGTEHDKLMGEAMDLSLKMLTEVEQGKNYKVVDQEYAAQVAALDAKIAKLPPLKVDQTNELLHRIHGSKEREIEKKQSAIALKGGLPKLPDYMMYDVDSIQPSK